MSIRNAIGTAQTQIDNTELDAALENLEAATEQVRQLALLNTADMILTRDVLAPGESWLK